MIKHIVLFDNIFLQPSLNCSIKNLSGFVLNTAMSFTMVLALKGIHELRD